MYAQLRRRYQPNEPKWIDQRQILSENWRKLPDIHRQWLLEQGSLTQHLIDISRDNFRVQRVKQYWATAKPGEAQLLNINPRSRCLIREVTLHGGFETWVFARSVMPLSSLSGDLYCLRSLKNSSLGQILFNQASLKRSPFEIAEIREQDAYMPNYLSSQIKAEQFRWARRCRFEVKNKPILVSEVFLPELMNRIG